MNAGHFHPTLERDFECLACQLNWPRESDGSMFLHLMPNGGLCKCSVRRNPGAAAPQPGDSNAQVF
jgi:hypothetical protein